MYSSCIFCSRHLGRNETLETFPVGEALAFDAWKGRLWAVCPHCGRWNLAPIEERWEAVEMAEKTFRDSRLRVHSENIGLAQLPEGTRLIRIGEALPGELAAWRYGRELRERRRAHRIQQIVRAVVGVVMTDALFLRIMARQKEIVYRLPAVSSPTGETVLIREKDLRGTRVGVEPGGELRVALPVTSSPAWRLWGWIQGGGALSGIELTGPRAHDLLSRTMVRVNAPGASDSDLREALKLVEQTGSVPEILSGIGGGGLMIAERQWTVTKPLVAQFLPESGSGRLPLSTMLALEMTLHEEGERSALEGELEILRARWREAEEIASIADVLPEDPLNRFTLPERT